MDSFTAKLKAIWYWILLGLGLIIGGFKLASLGIPDNYLIMAPGVIMMFVGLFGIIYGIRKPGKYYTGAPAQYPKQTAPVPQVSKQGFKGKLFSKNQYPDTQKSAPREETETEQDDGATKVVEGYAPNSVVIYKDAVKVQYVKNTSGVPWRCLNDGKHYHVYAVDPADGALVPWELPDNDPEHKHYDPREFANVIEMPAVKRFFTWQPSPFQKVALGIMVGFGCIELLVLYLIWSG